MRSPIKSYKEKKAAKNKNIKYFKDEARKEIYKEFAEIINKKDDEILTLKNEINNYKESLVKRSSDHDNEIRKILDQCEIDKKKSRDEIIDSKNNEIAELNRVHAEEVQSINKSHSEEVDIITKQHEAEMNTINSRMNEIEGNEARRQSRYATMMQGIEDVSNSVLKSFEWVSTIQAKLISVLYQNNKQIADTQDDLKILEEQRHNIMRLVNEKLPAIIAGKEKTINVK